jgi:cation:H+ antiporter
VLTVVTGLTVRLLYDNRLTRLESTWMLVLFSGLLAWSIRQGMRHKNDILAEETVQHPPRGGHRRSDPPHRG